MNIRSFKAIILLALLFAGFSHNANALDVKQFVDVCQSEQAGHQQFCNSYLGGALDAISVLNEIAKKDGQAPIYCKLETQIFDAKKIIEYVSSLKSKWNTKNAILPIIDYLSAIGGCESNADEK
jgi:hypothetical protein